MMAVGFWKRPMNDDKSSRDILQIAGGCICQDTFFKWLNDGSAKRISWNGWMADLPSESLQIPEWWIRKESLFKRLNNGSAKRTSSNARMMDPPSESLQMPEWWIHQDTLNADSAEELRKKVWYVASTKRMRDSPYSVILSRHSLLFSDFIF